MATPTIRCGVFYPTATRPVPVETLIRRLGITRQDTTDGPQKGKQTFWFASPEQFYRDIVGIYQLLTQVANHYPVPVFQIVPDKSEETAVRTKSESSGPYPEEAGAPPATATSDEPAPTPEPAPEPEAPKPRGKRAR